MAVEKLLRFLKDAIARDLGIIMDSGGDFALGIATRHELTPLHSEKASVNVGMTENIYSAFASGDKRIRKLVCTGVTDGYFRLLVDGSVFAVGKITPTKRVWVEDFGGGFVFAPDTKSIVLQVTNTGRVTSDYESIIYTGE